MGDLVHNEKQKLRATFLNNLAAASLAGGMLAPVFARGQSIVSIFISLILGLVFAVIFHWGALSCLSDLKE
jgi:lipopolysaccharide export LptBFGC system permease protein LptF